MQPGAAAESEEEEFQARRFFATRCAAAKLEEEEFQVRRCLEPGALLVAAESEEEFQRHDACGHSGANRE